MFWYLSPGSSFIDTFIDEKNSDLIDTFSEQILTSQIFRACPRLEIVQVRVFFFVIYEYT